MVVTIDEFAEMLDVPREAALVWLWAGMPCRERGCYEMGEGFKLVPSWAFDWVSSLSALAAVVGDERGRRALRLL